MELKIIRRWMQNGGEVSKRMLGVFMQVNKCLLENRNECKGIVIKKGRSGRMIWKEEGG
jgi:hypothetical protein